MRRRSLRLFLGLSAVLLGGLLAASPRVHAEETPPPPAPGSPEAERRDQILAIVDELRTEAARIRGLPWKQTVPADLLNREQLRKNLEEMIREELKPEEYERDLKILRRMGLLREDEDPIQIQLAFLEQGIAGYFNPKTKHFYVIDGLTGDSQRPTILHELVHALEDQYIDLEKSQKALEKDGDRLFALKCLVEGSAEHARLHYQKENPEIARLAASEQRKSQSASQMAKILQTVPGLLILPTLLQYQTGPAFVGRAVGEDYVGGMERLYADPPTSQEQVLHPGKYLAPGRDLPRTIAWPADVATSLGEGWKGHDALPIGELDFALWMDRWFGATEGRLDLQLMAQGRYWTKQAQTAAAGWDGIWSQVFDKDGKTTGLTLVSGWDSPADAMEAGAAIEAALRAQYGERFVETSRTEAEKGVVTLDFVGTYGPGRLEVRGEELRLADGFPDGTLARIWPRLSDIAVARDAADTWTRESEPDLLAGAAWSAATLGAGWKAPEGWKVESGASGVAVATKGDLRLRLSTLRGGVQQNLLPLYGSLKQRYPQAKLDFTLMEEVQVGTKEAGRLAAHDSVGVPNGKRREVYIVPLGDGLLLAEFEAPTSTWDAAAAQREQAMEGFVFGD